LCTLYALLVPIRVPGKGDPSLLLHEYSYRNVLVRCVMRYLSYISFLFWLVCHVWTLCLKFVFLLLSLIIIYFNCKCRGNGTEIWHNTQTKDSTWNYTNNKGHTTLNEYNANAINTKLAYYTLNSNSIEIHVVMNCCTDISQWPSLHSTSLHLCNPHFLTRIYSLFTSLHFIFWWFPPHLHFTSYISFITIFIKLLGFSGEGP
jgi:hypothetical protein